MILSSIGQRRDVVLYVKTKLLANPVSFENVFCFESVWSKILSNKTSTLLLGCVYRSPNSSLENSEHWTTLLKKVSQEKYSHLLVMGDFNYRKINWTDSSTNVGENHCSSLFLECIRDTYLCQHSADYISFPLWYIWKWSFCSYTLEGVSSVANVIAYEESQKTETPIF